MKQIIELNHNWWIKEATRTGSLSDGVIRAVLEEPPCESEGWLSSELPNTVQEILFEKGLLDSSVLETGEAENCRWVAERDWLFRCRFLRPAGNFADVYLDFAGLDTIVDIYLNGRHIAHHDTMFMPARVSVAQLLQSENELLLYFHSPHKIYHALEADIPPEQAGKIFPHCILRKPRQDFLDHGGAQPYYTPIGTFDVIRLVCVDQSEITNVDVDVRINEDLSRADISVNVLCSPGAGLVPSVVLRSPEGSCVHDLTGKAAQWQETQNGELSYRFCLPVLHPQLWWPRNYGGQPLYELTVSLHQNGQLLDSCRKELGLRKVEVVGDLKFRVNNTLVKLWGACITPMWGASHRWQRERAAVFLDYAVNANMNTLRLWGPSQPYDDELYQMADRLGLFLWQEFHTWGAHICDEPSFVATVLAEAAYDIKRLKHHPSILLWCGGNENLYMGELFDSCPIDRIGLDLIRYQLKDLVAQLDPYRYYHVSSPSSGIHANEAGFGDTHGSRASLSFLPGESHAHFFSEDIRTCIPELKSLERFIKPEELWPADFRDISTYGVKYMTLPPAWTRRTLGNIDIQSGPLERFYDASDAASLIYKVNAAAAYDLRLIINHARQGKPFYRSMDERLCNGYLLWKLDTPWPQIYCALIDYYLEPGQTYYTVKRGYSPIHVSLDLRDSVYVWGVNDTPKDFSGNLKVEIYDLEKEDFLDTRSFPVGIPSGESLILCNLNRLGKWGQFDLRSVLHAVLYDVEGRMVCEDFQYAVPERRLTFPPAKLSLSFNESGTLCITTDRFARCIELTGDEDGNQFGWHFGDNYFDLLPGQTKEISLLGCHRKGTVFAKPFYSPHIACIEL